MLLYFGDFDPGGLQISSFLRRTWKDMAKAVGWSPGQPVELTASDSTTSSSKRKGLTWIENLATAKGEYPLNDKRHRDHNKPYVQNYLGDYGVRKVESDALLKTTASRPLALPQGNPEVCAEECAGALPQNAGAGACRTTS